MDYQQPPQNPNDYPPQNQYPYPPEAYPPGPDYSQQGAYPPQGGYPPAAGPYPPNAQGGYYPPPVYGGYPAVPGPVPGKGKATASLVLGILSCVLMWFYLYGGILALIMSIIGLVLAISARKSIPSGMPGSGMATAGLVLCIIALSLSLLIVLAIVACAAYCSSVLGSSYYYW